MTFYGIQTSEFQVYSSCNLNLFYYPILALSVVYSRMLDISFKYHSTYLVSSVLIFLSISNKKELYENLRVDTAYGYIVNTVLINIRDIHSKYTGLVPLGGYSFILWYVFVFISSCHCSILVSVLGF